MSLSESGYYFGFPHRSEAYPDSFTESKKVIGKMANPDTEYFLLSDKTPKTPFITYLTENNLDFSENNLSEIVKESYPIIMAHKRYYNRPRPAQVNSSIKPAQSSTANTPSHPAGHTLQSYLLAEHLSESHPQHKSAFFTIAKRIADARVSVGLHYPSDNQRAIEIFNNSR